MDYYIEYKMWLYVNVDYLKLLLPKIAFQMCFV